MSPGPTARRTRVDAGRVTSARPGEPQRDQRPTGDRSRAPGQRGPAWPGLGI